MDADGRHIDRGFDGGAQMPLLVRDLPVEALARLRVLRYDLAVEKHEGPWPWASLLDPDLRSPDERAEVWMAAGYAVLLPLARAHLPRLVVERALPSADGAWLTLFLLDRTHDADRFAAGRLAVCRRLGGPEDADLYVAVAYHALFLDDTVLPPG